MSIPDTIDRSVLQSYLGDHVTGAAGGRARALKMAEWYADTPIGSRLRELADQIDEDQTHLEQLIERLGLQQRRPLRLVARAGEVVGRLKPNGRGPFASPVTPLLEIELLRGAVSAKQGLWETLAHYAPELGLDAAEYRERSRAAEEQRAVLTQMHDDLRDTALRPGQGITG